MAMEEFEKLNTVYTAIKDIDRIITSESEDKLDDLNTAIKSIDKSQIDQNSVNKILEAYREGILKIYDNLFANVNNNISEPGGLATIPQSGAIMTPEKSSSYDFDEIVENMSTLDKINNGYI